MSATVSTPARILTIEDEPSIEYRNLHPAYAGLRSSSDDAERLSAWQKGETGMPFVDACMRSLAATGWINFRMRAMLMSFAAHHLWLHWREPGLHLARQFIDYEPGIHWSQLQMQSGTTGINTFRIYNPVKQSQDQDPSGRFIREWLPELARVEERWIHTPWLMDERAQRDSSCLIGRDYPEPLVDHMAAARLARQRMGGLRRGKARDESRRILERHGSRRGGQAAGG